MVGSLLLCLTQLTIVTLLASLFAKRFMERSPRLAALLSELGIGMAVGLFVLAMLPISRPWMVSDWLPESQPIGRWLRLSLDSDLKLPLGRDKVDLESEVTAASAASESTAKIASKPSFERPWRHVSAAGLLLGVGALATLVLIGRLLLGTGLLIQMHRNSHVLTDVPDDAKLNALALSAGLQRRLTYRESIVIDSPCVSWLARDVIYLPVGFRDWSRRQREAALAHELAHLTRRDALHRLTATIGSTLVWFHPLVRVLWCQLITAQELAADRQAAILLGSASRYRRGLMELALQLDSPTTSPMNQHVSFSSHCMIRRIKMLQSLDRLADKRQTRRGWLAMGVLLASGVGAACWAVEDQPAARVATRSTAASGVDAIDGPLSGQRFQPWKSVGVGHGYTQVRFSQLVSHPAFRPLLESINDDLMVSAADPEIGLSFANVVSFEGRTHVDVAEIPEKHRTSDDKYQLSLSFDSFQLMCRQPVDWTKFAKEYDWDTLAPVDSEAVQIARQELSERGRSNELKFTRTKEIDVDKDATERLQRLWRRVDGGSLAVVSPVPGKHLATVRSAIASTNDPFGAFQLLKHIEYFGIGFDASDSQATEVPVRLAFAAEADSSPQEVVEALRLIQRALESQVDAHSPSEDPSSVGYVSMIEDILTWRVAVEDELVVVAGNVRAKSVTELLAYVDL